MMLIVAATKRGDADRLTDVTVRGFVFDGNAVNVAISGDAIVVNRVDNFFIQDNVTRQVRIGIFGNSSSGRIEGHFASGGNDGLAIGGGSHIYPARVEVRANRPRTILLWVPLWRARLESRRNCGPTSKNFRRCTVSKKGRRNDQQTLLQSNRNVRGVRSGVRLRSTGVGAVLWLYLN
jgi:hypothetical protein